MATDPRSRRSFLRSLTVSAVGLAGLWRFLTPARVPDSQRVTVALENVPPGGALVLPEPGIAVTRSERGEIAVLSLTCTHLGCRVAATEAGFACPCHGSRFDRKGRVAGGPAQAPLRQIPFAQQDGLLRIIV
jgi:Rieske Fe-S protein